MHRRVAPQTSPRWVQRFWNPWQSKLIFGSVELRKRLTIRPAPANYGSRKMTKGDPCPAAPAPTKAHDRLHRASLLHNSPCLSGAPPASTRRIIMRARFRHPAAVHLMRYWQGQSSISTLLIGATLSPWAARASREAKASRTQGCGPPSEPHRGLGDPVHADERRLRDDSSVSHAMA